MTRLFARLIFSFFSNLIALLVAVYFVDGFKIVPNSIDFAIVAGIFTLINIFIKPIFKLILSPIIIITLGLGIILVNALMLFILDIISLDITITGIMSLIYATLIISLINILISFPAKRLYMKRGV